MFILSAMILIASAQIILKYALNKIGTLPLNNIPLTLNLIFSNILILFGLILMILSSFFWLIALSKMDLSFVYPFMGLNYVAIVILSGLLFKENINTFRTIGVITILFGTFLMARDKK